VTVWPLPTADAGVDVSIWLNDCTILTATGGVGYNWSNGDATASTNVCPITTTTYTITVTDANGCTDSDELIVTVWPLPTADAGPDVSICLNDCTSLTATGGVGYIWNTGDATATINACPVITTTYTITVTDGNGCTDSDEVIVTVWPLPTADAGADVSICVGDCTLLNASGGISYLWSTGDVTQSLNVCPTDTTVYTVTVTDANGCTDSDDITVTVWPLPIANAGPDQTISNGVSTTLTGTASGGSGSYTYRWEPASELVDPTVEDPATIILCADTNFILIVTDAITGCVSLPDTMRVTIKGGPLTTCPEPTPDTICEGEMVQLHAATSGGSGVYTHLWWSKPPGFTSTAQDTSDYPVVSTWYYVTADDGFLTFTDSVFIPVTPFPTVDAGSDATICEDVTHTLSGAAANFASTLWTTSGDGTFHRYSMTPIIYSSKS